MDERCPTKARPDDYLRGNADPASPLPWDHGRRGRRRATRRCDRVVDVLIPISYRDRMQRGEITVLFRRWKRAQVVPGRVYRTTVGRLFVDAVDVVDPAHISARDVRAAGYATRAEAVAEPRGSEELPTYRIRFHALHEPDPRDALAASDLLSDDEVAGLDQRLARLDRASSHGPWTLAVLDAIAARPGVRAADLARSFGRDTQPFKLDVRKLKNLGLTISLQTGYRLSPRGEAYLRHRRLPQR